MSINVCVFVLQIQAFRYENSVQIKLLEVLSNTAKNKDDMTIIKWTYSQHLTVSHLDMRCLCSLKGKLWPPNWGNRGHRNGYFSVPLLFMIYTSLDGILISLTVFT